LPTIDVGKRKRICVSRTQLDRLRIRGRETEHEEKTLRPGEDRA
jgi:hypothetical protein